MRLDKLLQCPKKLLLKGVLKDMVMKNHLLQRFSVEKDIFSGCCQSDPKRKFDFI